MKRRPEEYHGLSAQEAADMEAMGCSRVDWERHRTMIAHGDLCASLMHLRAAQEWFKRGNPAVAVRLGNLAASLHELVPSYGEFTRAFSPIGKRRSER